ncbi:MAG: hypothetical protein M1837_003105 [Sclerophora amabilis]|nr:MAG: hypothetical protein M1837_003105 [Sclerophora amabilis]
MSNLSSAPRSDHESLAAKPPQDPATTSSTKEQTLQEPSRDGHRVAEEPISHKPSIRSGEGGSTTDKMSPLPSPTSQSRSSHRQSAIGPSSERVLSKDLESPGRAISVVLLLTNGARHPYKIDDKYLKKRNINGGDTDPLNISVYTLKELIWREWREEWEPRSSSPSSIRLIHFGRLLDDKAPLRDCRFNSEGPNVVHMTVKPQEFVDEEDAKTSKKGLTGDRDGDERTTRCRCTIL